MNTHGRYRQFFGKPQVGVSVITNCSTHCVKPKNLEELPPKKKTLHLFRHYRDIFTSITLYKQLRVTGGKKKMTNLEKYVNMANGSEIGCYFTITR